MDDDEGDVRVRVDPSASHYHAGEIAVFTISFTNTRPAPAPQTPRPALSRTSSAEGQIGVYGRNRGHRRAISSVSEARMARPPTSPGLRRPAPPMTHKYTPSSLSSSSSSPPPKAPRQGLIGMSKKLNGESRSLSVAITSHEAFRELDGIVALNGSGTPTTPVGSHPPLPKRSRTLTGIPQSHPHARKDSAALDGAFPSVSSLHKLPATPSTSTFAMSLAPITESGSSDLVAPSPLGPGRGRHNGFGPARRASTPSLSVQAPTPPSASPSPLPNFYPDSEAPSPVTPLNDNSALILLAHAQLTGTLSLDPPSAALAVSWRAAEIGTGRRVVGGGRMGIGVSHPRTRPRAASGVGGWFGLSAGSSTDLSGTGVRAALGLGGLASAGSSTASLASAPPDSPATRPINGRRGHQRATSMASFIPGMASISALLSGDDTSSDGHSRDGAISPTANGSTAVEGMGPSATVEEGVFPVLETQPSVLAVDLSLQPGETRSYRYSITLPSALPPSFRGKYFKITYHLVVGTTRPDAQPDAGQLRRIIRVPIRMYNHVAVGQSPRPYDLMWPLARRREGSMLVGRVEEGKGGTDERESGLAQIASNPTPFDKGKITRKELETYAKRLLATAANGLVDGVNGLKINPNPNAYDDDEGADMSCRDAVEVVTRHSKKMSFDIAKDGQTVAVVTFVKGAYRLGETVLAAIEFNDLALEGRVLKYSATLESTESFALHTPAPQTRKYAEHHAALALGTQRAAFSLDIPSDGAPSFGLVLNPTTGQANGKTVPNGNYRALKVEGGLQWRIRMALLVCMAPPSRSRNVVRDGLGNEWGEAWRATSDLAPLAPAPESGGSESWGAFFGRWTGDEDGEGAEEKWIKTKLETLECELPITVFPGSTAYQPSGFDTWA
ncbi:Rgp1 domain protein [Ceratobasidium sp. AG-Ba]|nr:Rgp1 domain protein [Ceratobasidium sp. AG-Ba]QRV91791.1 Rgp1 domain protein [Ceratobasidium sp. AG-Ba]